MSGVIFGFENEEKWDDGATEVCKLEGGGDNFSV